MKKDHEADRSRQFIACMLIVSLTPLATGCDTMRDSTLTGRLWDPGEVNRCLPAPQPNLKLYRTPDDKDVLVTYDELREKNDSIRRRAFFFQPNVRRLEAHKRPKFVSPDKVVELKLIRVSEAGNTNAPVIFAKISADNQAFTLIWFGTDFGPYALPVYVDRGSEVRRALLTPLATMGDVIVVVVVVAVVAGAIVGYGYPSGASH